MSLYPVHRFRGLLVLFTTLFRSLIAFVFMLCLSVATIVTPVQADPLFPNSDSNTTTYIAYGENSWNDFDLEVILRHQSCIRCILSGADLSGVDLSGADFFETNLRAANLAGANLKGAKLYRVKLHEANLKDAKVSVDQLLDSNLNNTTLPNGEVSDAP